MENPPKGFNPFPKSLGHNDSARGKGLILNSTSGVVQGAGEFPLKLQLPLLIPVRGELSIRSAPRLTSSPTLLGACTPPPETLYSSEEADAYTQAPKRSKPFDKHAHQGGRFDGSCGGGNGHQRRTGGGGHQSGRRSHGCREKSPSGGDSGSARAHSGGRSEPRRRATNAFPPAHPRKSPWVPSFPRSRLSHIEPTPE